jgi:dCTP deaminase
MAAEMVPTAEDLGEFRAHYAGFFDPGFGLSEGTLHGTRGVLEVRGRDVPFVLEHGQPVARLVYEPLASPPDHLYGDNGSHYQGQSLKLSKLFQAWS